MGCPPVVQRPICKNRESTGRYQAVRTVTGPETTIHAPASAVVVAVPLPREPRTDVPGTAPALCAVALGCALQVNFGQYHPLALAWLSVALALCLLCVAKPQWRAFRFLESRAALVVALALATQFTVLLTRSPGATGRLGDGSSLLPFRIGVVAAGVVCAAGMWGGRRWYFPSVAALLLTYMLTGFWVLRAAPEPGVDVCLFQRGAAAALLRGDNPYAITFADPYKDSSRFYGPGVSVDGRLQFGYPYPPLSLLLVAPAHALGDFRYAHLVAMTLAGALIALARPGRLAFAAAALLLFTPRGFFVLEAGWTEPLAVLLLSATVFVACRSPGSIPVALGALIAVKQYLLLVVLVAPLLPRFCRGRWKETFWKTGIVIGAITLPLALWDLPAFVHSTVLLQFRQPFRDDALSYLVPLAHLLGTRPPAWIGLALAAAAAVMAVRKSPRTPSGFALALALVLLTFFAFNKQAFCNYYHAVIGALCCAAGTARFSAENEPN
jgi:hypothetical protein